MNENLVTIARFALDLTLKATVLLAVTAIALVGLRRASAAVRTIRPKRLPPAPAAR